MVRWSLSEEMAMKEKSYTSLQLEIIFPVNDNNNCNGLQCDHLLTSWIIPFNSHKNSMTEEDVKGQ